MIVNFDLLILFFDYECKGKDYFSNYQTKKQLFFKKNETFLQNADLQTVTKANIF
jgi:hypothetical protein